MKRNILSISPTVGMAWGNPCVLAFVVKLSPSLSLRFLHYPALLSALCSIAVQSLPYKTEN